MDAAEPCPNCHALKEKLARLRQERQGLIEGVKGILGNVNPAAFRTDTKDGLRYAALIAAINNPGAE